MTIEEKRELVHEFCIATDCHGCPMREGGICSILISNATEEELDDAINKLRTPTNDSVNHPSHYTDGKIECIEYIKDKLTAEEFQGFCKGNALKYVSRAGKKDPNKYAEDLQKAVFYLNKAIEERGNTNEDND
jgi:hypothetical protein